MKKYKTNHLVRSLLILAIGFSLMACRPAASPQNQAPVAAREITDDLNHSVKLSAKIERAVSLAPNLTEIIFAVDGGRTLVGDTTYCDYPDAAKTIQKVGDTLNPNIETIIALKPQVVFVSTASQIESFSKALEAQDIAVFVTNSKDLESVYRSIAQIGEILGTSEKAQQVIEDMKRRAQTVESRTSQAREVKTFVQISKEPLFTIGKDSFMTDLINRAGGVSVTANVPEGYPKFSKESALALQPEAIIISDSPDNPAPNEVFKDSPAVKTGRVYKIKSDLLSRPGPRLVDGLEQIAKDLHPENFQ